MRDSLKALVIIVGIIAFVGLAIYIFKEVKEGVIMQKKAQAMQDVAGEVKGLVGDLIGRKS